ncbi:xylulokinase [Jonesia quinghaiensis]|uniref:xylulokinase n=1 Tax=Jonesia quinghaiensis TaxID=262806 RepID=UPI0004921E6F|nr:FGGY family carbohydrate kinase [Jonesia quinghaiensis]
MTRRLVAGVDSSTQSCKIVIRDAETGALVRSGSAKHPNGTEVHPTHWWTAYQEAAAAAGGLDDVEAIAVGGQQHGMVALDENGDVIRDALLWNDTRSAAAARDLITDLGALRGTDGAHAYAHEIGLVPVASFTATKVRWMRDTEPHNMTRVAAIALPHDWLMWQIIGAGGEPGAARDLTALATDRSDASGTAYFNPTTGQYDRELFELAAGPGTFDRITLPRVLTPNEAAGRTPWGAIVGPGAGDNAGAALGLGAAAGDIVLSVGTSGVVTAVSAQQVCDVTGNVAGFASATGDYLPLVCTINASRILDVACRMLSVDYDELARLALSAQPGAGGLVLVPYFEGERTPNRPDATGTLHGMTLENTTPANIARAAVEALLCSLADGVDALRSLGVDVQRLLLIGGGAQSVATRTIAPQVFGMPVTVPAAGEYVADGAARQAAWALLGGDTPPHWPLAGVQVFEGEPQPIIREQYAAVRDLA